MILYDWIINQLLPIFLPQSVLEQVLYYAKNSSGEGIYPAVTVADAIGAFFACSVGFCAVFFLVWVPFRGILHLLRWSKWRGYGRR